MSQNTKLKTTQRKAIEMTKDGTLIMIDATEAQTTTEKAKKLGMGSVLDDLRSPDMNPRRRL